MTEERSQTCILKAVSESQPDDYMRYVANVHQKMRGWSYSKRAIARSLHK
ncbi:hypothetical protein QUA13_06160 [Microcoleus sp. S28C3]